MDERRPPEPVERHRTIITCLVLVAFAARIYNLGGQSLWYDEAYSVWASESLDSVFARLDPVYSPLYYLTLLGWRAIAGSSEFAVRFPSVLAGVLTLPATWWLLGLLRVRRPLLVVTLLTISPFAVYYSQETRVYALTTLLSVFALGSFVKAVERQSPGAWARYCITMLVAIASHYYAVFLLAPIVVWFIVARLKPIRGFLVSHGVISAFLILLASVTLGGLASYQLPASGTPASAIGFLESIVRSAALGPRVPEDTSAALPAASLIWAVLLISGSLAALQAARSGLSRIAAVAVATVFVAAYLLQLRLPWFYPRYVLYLLPLMLVVVADGSAFLGRRLGGLLAALCAGTSLLGVGASALSPLWQRDDYRTVAKYVADGQGRSERVVIQSAYYNPAWHRYWTGGDVRYVPSTIPLDPARTEGELREAIQGTGIWLVQWSSPVSDPSDLVGHWLEAHAIDAGTRWYGEITLRHFFTRPPGWVRPEHPVDIDFGGLNLVGYDGVDAVLPGDRLKATLYWQVDATTNRALTRYVHLVDAGGVRITQLDGPPLSGAIATSAWRIGERYWDEIVLPIPERQLDGWYWLTVGLYDDDDRPESRIPGAGGGPIDQVRLGPVALGKYGWRTVESEGYTQAPAQISKVGTLPSVVHPADSIDVAVLWKSQVRPPIDWTAFVHVIDWTGQLVAQVDRPAGPANRTSRRWQNGEEVGDLFRIGLPANLTSGRYQVLAGLYDPKTGDRLTLGPSAGAVALGTIEVVQNGR